MTKTANIISKKIDGETIKLVIKNFSIQESQFKIINEEEGTFEAYVSVFGNKDSYGEIVEKGAFTEWLTLYKGRYPKGVWAHNWDEPIIKTIEIYEDDHGLKVKGKFVLEVQRAREIYALMKEGVITDFSFGFGVLEDSWDEVNRVRHLKKIAIYEYSPVLVGANNQATLLNVKSAEGVADEENQDGTDDTTDNEEEKNNTTTDEGDQGDATDEIADESNDEEKSKKPKSKKSTALKDAIIALRSATEALESLAGDDTDEGDESDLGNQGSEDPVHPGKGTPEHTFIKGILRDARKADKAVEAVILRAKSIINN